jgi:hypothetical protein
MAGSSGAAAPKTAPPEKTPSTSAVEMAVHYPAASGVRVPADGEVLGLDATKLFDVITKLGASVAKIQEDLVTPPPWVADVSEKLKRMDKLDRGFSSLTDVVGNLMTVANISDRQSADDLAAVRQKTAKTKGEEELQAPDPFAIQQFNGLRSQLEAFERKMAAAPAYEDVEQLKDYVHERTKKLKATLVTLQGAMERRFDGKMKEHLEGFDKWQADLMEVTAGRLRVLEDQIKETNVEFDDFREVNGSELHDVQEATANNKAWATREFSSCNAQTLNLQVMIHKVVERVDALEKGAEARQAFIEKLARNIQEKLESIDRRESNTKERADGVDEKIVLLEEGFKKNNQETVDNKQGIDKMFKRIEWQDLRIAEETLKIDEAQKSLAATSETVEGIQITQSAEREERLGEIKTVRTTALVLDQKIIKLHDSHRELATDVNDIASGVKDHPDKIEFMEETLEVLKKTLRAEAAMRDELKVSLSSMSERQDAFVKVQRELNQVLQKTENQEKFIKNLELKQNEIAEEYAEDRMTIVAVKEAVQEVGVEVRETQRDVKTNSEAVEKTFGAVKRETVLLQKHQKKLETIVNDDDPTSGPGGANRRTTMARRPVEMQVKFVTNEAHGVASACLAYELLCVEKNYLVDFPHDTILAISESALEMATYIAEKVDMWAVGQMILERPDDNPFTDDDVITQKLVEQQTWIDEAKASVASQCERPPTPLQLQARDRFFQRASSALAMGLSKHDQVIVTQPTIIKRNQPIPTCVACNRPLPVKKSKSEIARRKTLDANGAVDAKGKPKSLMGLKPRKAKTPQEEERAELGSGPKFIYRGGFKMPRKPSLAGGPDDGSASLPALRPSTVPAGAGSSHGGGSSVDSPSSNHIWVDNPKPEDPNDDWVEGSEWN